MTKQKFSILIVSKQRDNRKLEAQMLEPIRKSSY